MLLEMGQNSGVLTNLGGVLYYLYPPSGLMKSIGSHGSSSLLFMMNGL